MKLDRVLHVRRHAPFDDPERARVEDMAIRRVENNAEELFEAYRKLPGAMGGRYVNSDLFKEVFPEYSASPAHRTLFNVPIHNSAAVLANELFHRMVAAPAMDNNNRILFITGIPGAGKTSAISKGALDIKQYKVIYEGQLANFEQAKEKISWSLSNNNDVDVVIFHRDPETALQYTFLRFNSIGRGASITAMSNIQGNLAASMKSLYDIFYKNVTFCVFDLRSNSFQPVCGKQFIDILQSEGDRDAIRRRLETELERWRQSGRINEACYREAAGRSPFSLAALQELYEQSQGTQRGAEGQSESADGEREAPLVGTRQTEEGIESRARENRDAQQALVDGADAFGVLVQT